MQNKNIIKGKEWHDYLKKNGVMHIQQTALHSFTYNFTSVYKINKYYFTLGILAGYRNKASIKRAITSNYAK